MKRSISPEIDMAIHIKCDKCGSELKEPGALVFGPPEAPPEIPTGEHSIEIPDATRASGANSKTEKRHLCTACWEAIDAWFRTIYTPDYIRAMNEKYNMSSGFIVMTKHPTPEFWSVKDFNEALNIMEKLKNKHKIQSTIFTPLITTQDENS
jgi:hypothetical protein